MDTKIIKYLYSGSSLFTNHFAERHKVEIWVMEHPNGNDKIVLGWEQNPFKKDSANPIKLKQEPRIAMIPNYRLENLITDGELNSPQESTIPEDLYNQIFEILKLEAGLYIAHNMLEGMLAHYSTANA